MKRILLLSGLILCLFPLTAQVLIVRDLATHSPLEFVTVYSVRAQQHVTTNQKGKADISAFKGDSIHIRLLGYKPAVYSYPVLEEKQFKVFLEPSRLSLDEVVISATRWQQEKKDIPSKITSIQKQEILLQNPQTAADLLTTSGEVFVQKSQLGGGSPMIRGFATNRVLLTVDGVRMNNAIFRSGNIQNVVSLDPLAVERTEILFGPGAVMYGSDAIGGAMNFYTLTPQFTTAEKPFVKGSAMSRYSTANEEKTGHFDFNLGFKKWAFLSSASFGDFGNLRMGSHGPDDFLRPEYQIQIDGKDTIVVNPDPRVQIPTAYNQLNLMQKIRFAPNEKWDFSYGLHYSTTSDVPRYDRLIEPGKNKLRDGEWYYGPQVWLMNVLNIANTSNNRLYNKMGITLSQQRFQESRHNRNFAGYVLSHRTEIVDAFSLSIDLDKQFDEKKTVLYGIEMVRNEIGSFAEMENIATGETSPLNTRYPNGSQWNSLAGYINYLYKATEKITFQSGLRYSHILLDATFDTTFVPLPFTQAKVNNGSLTGSAGIAFRPGKNWQFNANLSTGFRAPNIDDIGKVFDSEPGAVIVPNPGLKSEYAYNGEMGITRIFTDILKADLTGYYTLLENAMVRREFTLNGEDSILYEGEMSKVLAIQNAANANVYGLQAGLEVKLPYRFSFISRFTYQLGKEELEDGTYAPLRHAVPWFGVSRLTYSGSKLKAEFYVMYQSGVAFNQLPPSESAKPHLYAKDSNGNPFAPLWYTLNFKVMYQITDFLMANAGVENITDARYRPYSSGISAPGVNFIASLRVNF